MAYERKTQRQPYNREGMTAVEAIAMFRQAVEDNGGAQQWWDPAKRREFIKRIAAPIAKRTDGRAQRQLRDAVADVLFPGWRTLAKDLRKGANQERRRERLQAEATKAKAKAARKAKARPRDAERAGCVACGVTRQVRDDSGRCVNRSRCEARAHRTGRGAVAA